MLPFPLYIEPEVLPTQQNLNAIQQKAASLLPHRLSYLPAQLVVKHMLALESKAVRPSW